MKIAEKLLKVMSRTKANTKKEICCTEVIKDVIFHKTFASYNNSCFELRFKQINSYLIKSLEKKRAEHSMDR